MSAPDFFFAVNATFRHIHDRFGMPALVRYWRELGRDYYRARWQRWRREGSAAVAQDWRDYFAEEPGASVDVTIDANDDAVVLDVHVCPAIKHLRDNGRDIVPYFCEHCDHICSAMADSAGFAFTRTGGMGCCRQRFVPVSVRAAEVH